MTGHLTCFITDDRHTVPSLALLVDCDPAAAHRFAIHDLQTNPHHLAIEIRDEEKLVCAVWRDELDAAPPSLQFG